MGSWRNEEAVLTSPADRAPLDGVTASLNHWIAVDTLAIQANIASIRACIGAAPEVIGVVKANAYGHGAVQFAHQLVRSGVNRLAVAWVSEGVALRKSGLATPVLVLGHADPTDAPSAVRHNLALTCHSEELLAALSAAACKAGRLATIHIKVDTGLHRSGLSLEEAASLAERARETPGIQVEGLWTHMANADEQDDSFSDEQHAAFEVAIKRLPWIPFRHAANSATALRRPELRYDGVRTGIAMYGCLPDFCPDVGLRPVLTLAARVARVVDVRAGEGVSYGLTWRAERDSQVALVPVGYADGWRRALGNRGTVLIGSRRCRMVGRVCMDQFLADVTGMDVVEGDEVVLIGSQGDERITAEDVAAELGTIPWEVLAGLQARIPRIYVGADGAVCF